MPTHIPSPHNGIRHRQYFLIPAEASIHTARSYLKMTEIAAITDSHQAFRASDTVKGNGGEFDPMSLVERSPEANVPVNALVAGFHLRQIGTDATHVRLLADAAWSVRLPPILVQRQGSRVIDGLHRLEAAKIRGDKTIKARVIDCSDAEALILAVKSNTLHGLPLSRADRISSAKRILTTHPDWSDRALAAVTGLSAKAIASIRNSSANGVQFDGKRLGRDGKRHPVASVGGRQRVLDYISAHPEASIREVARETDVSIGTVHDVREKIRKGEPVVPETRTTGEEESHISHGAGNYPAEQGPGGSGQETRCLGRNDAQDPQGGVPGAVRALHARGTVGNSRQASWLVIAGRLSGDPTLRYTEGGRAFLRWMATHCAQADEWREFVDAVPQHWLDEVGQLADAMSAEWRQFAERLRSKEVVAN
jgi:hypothetical protein